jgi:hypothetical protein
MNNSRIPAITAMCRNEFSVDARSVFLRRTHALYETAIANPGAASRTTAMSSACGLAPMSVPSCSLRDRHQRRGEDSAVAATVRTWRADGATSPSSLVITLSGQSG